MKNMILQSTKIIVLLNIHVRDPELPYMERSAAVTLA